jgi:hypothetical protein
MDIETMPPLITRGVLIDVAEFEQVDHLEAGYAIQPAELDETLAAQKSEVRPGEPSTFAYGLGSALEDTGELLVW